jgi:hypothetical protein
VSTSPLPQTSAPGPDARPDLDTVRRFLAAREGELLELVVMPTRGGADGEVFALPEQLEQALTFVTRHSGPDSTVSVGIATTSPEGVHRLAEEHRKGIRARIQAPDHVDYRWAVADLDPKGEVTLDDLRIRLASMPAPTVLVASGRGLHAWWALSAPVAIDEGRELMRDLARALGGDKAMASPAQVLRLPGTWNPKPEVQRHAVVADADLSRRYTLQELSEAAEQLSPRPEPGESSRPRPSARPGQDDDLRERVRRELREQNPLDEHLTRLSGRPTAGKWRCPFGDHDKTASLKLLSGNHDRWICFGGNHPENYGLRTDQGFSGDVIDLLADEQGRTAGEFLADELRRRAPQKSQQRKESQDGRPGQKEQPRQSSGSTRREDSEDRKVSQAEVLVEMAMEQYVLGRAANGETFARARRGAQYVFWLRGEDSLRSKLANQYFHRTGKVPSQNALANAVRVLDGQALEKEPTTVGLRVAPLKTDDADAGMVLDLGDMTGRAVVMRPSGWELVEKSPVLFRRTELTSGLPAPVRGGDLEELRALLNVTDESWPLLVAWLVATLFSEVAHPILLMRGEQGSGKTTAARTLVSLVDPSEAPMKPSPREDGWGPMAQGSYVIGIDNISTIPAWMSDAWCRAVTGDAYVARKLYNDLALTVSRFRRVMVLTSIDPGSMRGDLAERLLTVELESITARRRTTERELDERWKAAHPRILGALLDLVVEVLQVLPEARALCDETGRHRLADFSEILTACDLVRGTSSVETYAELNENLASEVVEGDQWATVLQEFLTRHFTEQALAGRDPAWVGQSSTLHEVLDQHTPPQRPKNWPSSPRAVAGRLTRLATVLRSKGFEVEQRRSHGTRWVRIAPVQDEQFSTPPLVADSLLDLPEESPEDPQQEWYP